MTNDPDYYIGSVSELGSYLFTEDAIIEFASKYDPQPFHMDADAARNSVFGGLCASGWHTAAIWMKLNLIHKSRREAERIEKGLPNIEYGPSPGFRNLRWIKPVFAGQTITYYQSITGLKPFRGRPGWSLMFGHSGARDENDSPVMSFDNAVLVRLYPDLARTFP